MRSNRLLKRVRRRLSRVYDDLKRRGWRHLAIRALNFALYLLWAPRVLRRRLGPLAGRVKPVLARLPGCRRLLPPPTGVRRFVAPALGRLEFLRELQRRQIRCLVLRWFENLPDWPAGEDMDVLIADEDLEAVRDLFVACPDTIPVDLYTVSARKGWRGLPYYPPHAARRMLERRVLFRDTCCVPCAEDHFLSLAYHVVYHKTESSGLPVRREAGGLPPAQGEHDYAGILAALAHQAGFRVDMTLEALAAVLDEAGWSPSVDTLRKLAGRSAWLRSRLPPPPEAAGEGELVVFVLRDYVIEHNLLDFVLAWFADRSHALDIVRVLVLGEDERARAAREIRGGEWGRGPFPVSGGPPAVLLVTFDYHPVPVPPARRKTHPYITNGHVFFKEELRDEINRGMLRTRWTNCIHSADDELEAWDYLSAALAPEKVGRLRAEIMSLRRAYRTDFPVRHTWNSKHTRGKIELIDYNGAAAVKKTFKPGRERFLEREVFACSELSGRHPAIPKLIARGENYLVVPYFEDILAGKVKAERQRILRERGDQIVDFMKFLYQNGYALIDFQTDNVIVTPGGELKVIDFEFLYRYETRPDSFARAFEVAGVPKDFRGDLPRYHRPERDYRRVWRNILDGYRLDTRERTARHGG